MPGLNKIYRFTQNCEGEKALWREFLWGRVDGWCHSLSRYVSICSQL